MMKMINEELDVESRAGFNPRVRLCCGEVGGGHDVTARQNRIAEGPQQTFVSTSQDDTTRQHVDDDTTPR